MVMKKGKYLVLGLFPLAISAELLDTSVERSVIPLKQTERDADRDTAGPRQTAQWNADPSRQMAVDPSKGTPGSQKANSQDVVDQLILTGSDIKEVIGILEKLTGRTALMEQKLPTTKISIEVQEPISRQEAISAIESVLSLNGVAIVDMGEKFMKAVTSKSAITQSPDIVDESLLAYEPNQKVLSKFFRLKYLDVTEFQKLIKPLLTPSSSNSILFAASNALFITDTMANLQSIENLIKQTDKPISMIETINFIPINNIKASVIVKKFDQLKRGTLKKYLSSATIDCDDSSNQLIVITPQENFSTIEGIAKQLDTKCELLLRSEVLRIKHGDAKKITDIVSGIIKEQRSRIEKENKMAFDRQQAQMTAQGTLANALAQAASGSRSNQQISNSYSDFIASQQLPNELGEEQAAHFSANLTLAAEERSNSVIIYGTASDLAQVRGLIANLDVLLDQVRIEVIVAQVTLKEGQQSGLEALNLGQNMDVPATSFAAKSMAVKHDINFSAEFGTNDAGYGGISSATGTLKNFALNNIFKKAKVDSNVKILSTPNLVTTHNRKALIKIGEERPFVDSNTKSAESASAPERVQIQYKHVGLELTVTPLIGSNGIIQMEIEQKVSKHQEDVDVAGLKAPLLTEKQINSFISVANEDVIVLAGFKEKTNAKSSGKMFLLGDLPILGDMFFSPKARKEETQELIIFIKPTIILHPQDEAAYLNKRLEVTNFKDDIEHYKMTGDFPKTDPFPKDTILGLNGQEMKKKSDEKRKQKQEAEAAASKSELSAKVAPSSTSPIESPKPTPTAQTAQTLPKVDGNQSKPLTRRQKKAAQASKAADNALPSATQKSVIADSTKEAKPLTRRQKKAAQAADNALPGATQKSVIADSTKETKPLTRKQKQRAQNVKDSNASENKLSEQFTKQAKKHIRRR
jgi:general secretion pathway protein D